MPDRLPVYDLPLPGYEDPYSRPYHRVWSLPVRLQLPIRLPGRSPSRPSAGTRWVSGSQPLSQPILANHAIDAEITVIGLHELAIMLAAVEA